MKSLEIIKEEIAKNIYLGNNYYLQFKINYKKNIEAKIPDTITFFKQCRCSSCTISKLLMEVLNPT